MIESMAVVDLKVSDAGYTKDLYSNIDCYIGYKFVRFEVDGVVKPCCGYPYSVGDYLKEDWQRIWHSSAMAEFRKKTAAMSKGRWHLSTPEWAFCQNCSHRSLNVEADRELKKYIEGDKKSKSAPLDSNRKRFNLFKNLKLWPARIFGPQK